MLTIEHFRGLFPRLGEEVYLDTGQRGLTPPALTEVGCQVLQDWEAFDYSRNRQLAKQTKERLAKLLRVQTDEIALVSSTGQGLNTIATAVNYQSGDNVVIADSEHASNFFPWANLREKGVELRLVPCPSGVLHPEDYRPYIDQRTKVVSASLVSFYPGAWLDARSLADIAHEAGALFVLDAVQAVGILPVYPRELGADAVVAAAYKGFMSAHGAGFIYVAKEALARLSPAHLYMFGVDGEHGMIGDAYASPDYTLKPNALALEPSSHAVGIAQMGKALEYILELGVEQIESHVCALTASLGNGLQKLGYSLDTPLEPDYRRHIVCVRIQNAPDCVEYLASQKIRASARRHGVRLAFHAYNNQADVERVLEAFAAYKNL